MTHECIRIKTDLDVRIRAGESGEQSLLVDLHLDQHLQLPISLVQLPFAVGNLFHEIRFRASTLLLHGGHLVAEAHRQQFLLVDGSAPLLELPHVPGHEVPELFHFFDKVLGVIPEGLGLTLTLRVKETDAVRLARENCEEK